MTDGPEKPEKAAPGSPRTLPGKRTHSAPPVGSLREGDHPDPAAMLGLYYRTTYGPIPDAAELARYKEVYPDAPELVFRDFQARSEHRPAMESGALELEREVVRADIAAERRGQVIAAVILALIFLCGTFLIWTGHDTAGTVVISVDAVSISGLFIYGEQQKRKLLAEKPTEPPSEGGR